MPASSALVYIPPNPKFKPRYRALAVTSDHGLVFFVRAFIWHFDGINGRAFNNPSRSSRWITQNTTLSGAARFTGHHH